jgi:gliding motility-associated-like protein
MKNKKLLFLFVLFLSISQIFAEDYYWVGGQGNWSDLNSWRTASGQIPNEVPDSEDNVIFNQYSFENDYDTVFILSGNPYCKNMTWVNIQDTVVMYGNNLNAIFNIYGSITFHPKVKNEYYGKIYFASDLPGNTITCAGTRFPGDIWFEGSGEYILQDTLFVYDSTDWQAIIDTLNPVEPSQPNPLIIHENGYFNSNNQTIINRGFIMSGNKARKVNLQNSHILMVGSWILSAENLDFDATNSHILIGGDMNNFAGETVTYHDIDFLPVDGSIKNTDIRSIIRKVHFLGSGTLDGKKTPGIEGNFTIDTLLFEGAITLMGPIVCAVKGIDNYIWYTRVNMVHGEFETNESFYHRVDFNGSDFGLGLPSFIKGPGNESDSIFFNVPKGIIAGRHQINDYLFFKTDGVVGADLEMKNEINHAVFSGNGWFEGNNDFNKVTLNTGFTYLMNADSLIHPGSVETNTYIQTINAIEVTNNDDCLIGITYLQSAQKLTSAVMDYTGPPVGFKYFAVKDIKNIGSTISITKGINLGHNTGFYFDPAPGAQLEPRTLYWVGGQGNWFDETHWSLVSGGGGGPGDQCPPILLDDVFFDANSGFQAEDTVYVDRKNVFVNDMTWTDDVPNYPCLEGADTCAFRMWGSLKLSPAMCYWFWGNMYFESEDDDEWETIDVTWTYDSNLVYYLLNQTYFYGENGKWRFDSQVWNLFDSLFVKMGSIELQNDTLETLNFIADDTLQKGIYFLEKTLCVVHQYQANAWLLNAWLPDSVFLYDFGESTIRAMGDITPPMGAPPGFCNIRTYVGEVDYHNIEFSTPDVSGIKSMLISESQNSYNLVDYYVLYGDAVGTGFIDTLTYKRVWDIDPVTGDSVIVVSADGCKIRNNFTTNFLFAESYGDTLIGNQQIDTAYFKGDNGAMFGYNEIGYLQADSLMTMMLKNYVWDKAILYGNGKFKGNNKMERLELTATKKYYFQHDVMDSGESDTTIIVKDLLMLGACDGTIRIQSDSIGTKSYILYQALSPTYPDFTAKYASIRDIYMVPYNGNEYIAENSVDLGNNTNWTFTLTEDQNYYWVGGTGNWGDWNHWSFTSGGVPIPEQCTPKEINTVIFDDNSFLTGSDTVTVDVKNAYCNSMYWKNSSMYDPLFINSDTTSGLYIYGSLELSHSMNYAYSGTIFFDQFNDPLVLADTITTRGNLFLNHIRFQGINDEVVLGDDVTMFIDPPNSIFRSVFLEHGALVLNGNHLSTAGFYSTYKNNRTLNMVNSDVTLRYDYGKAWRVNGANLNLFAHNSNIYNQSLQGSMMTENGDYLKYHNVYLNGFTDSLANLNNVVEYNIISANEIWGIITGDFIADTILLRGQYSGIYKKSKTNVVIIDTASGSINQNHLINKCIVNRYGEINGSNYIKYCVFYDDGKFTGNNDFDTLILFPGGGNTQYQGNWFTFQSDSTQTIHDSLYIRGNQCSSITLISTNTSKLAYLKKDKPGYDVSCDYLDIYNVSAVDDFVDFYAGDYSKALPDPTNPPPGWIFENAQGYVYGFNGRTERFCEGTEFVIDAGDFNGDTYTQYFWQGSPLPGDDTYTITEPGIYHIQVQYFEGCTVDDYIVIELHYPPLADMDDGPFCEGDPINVYVSPDNNAYKYYWSSGGITEQIIADTSMNGGIYVLVEDTINGCVATVEKTIEVKPVPKPEEVLGEDVWLNFGETVTIDAGEGESYEWSSLPETTVSDSTSRIITVPGANDPTLYLVQVELDGCFGQGEKLVNMYPLSRLGIPTAFSPNKEDDINPRLYLLGSGFAQVTFRIFDRYGKLVFESTDPNGSEGWDGTFEGRDLEMDVYTYYVKVIYQDGGVEERKGNVTLLR